MLLRRLWEAGANRAGWDGAAKEAGDGREKHGERDRMWNDWRHGAANYRQRFLTARITMIFYRC